MFIIVADAPRASQPPELGPPGLHVLPGCWLVCASPRTAGQFCLRDGQYPAHCHRWHSPLASGVPSRDLGIYGLCPSLADRGPDKSPRDLPGSLGFQTHFSLKMFVPVLLGVAIFWPVLRKASGHPDHTHHSYVQTRIALGDISVSKAPVWPPFVTETHNPQRWVDTQWDPLQRVAPALLSAPRGRGGPPRGQPPKSRPTCGSVAQSWGSTPRPPHPRPTCVTLGSVTAHHLCHLMVIVNSPIRKTGKFHCLHFSGGKTESPRGCEACPQIAQQAPGSPTSPVQTQSVHWVENWGYRAGGTLTFGSHWLTGPPQRGVC